MPMEYLSKQRYDEIAAELDRLINEVYPRVKDDLVETRAGGPERECGLSGGQAEPGENHQPYPFPAKGPGVFPRD